MPRIAADTQPVQLIFDFDSTVVALEGLDELARGVPQVAAFVPKGFVVPDILADRQADFVPVEIDRRVFLCRLEIAVLVEDIVGREQGLEDEARRSAFFENGGGIEK